MVNFYKFFPLVAFVASIAIPGNTQAGQTEQRAANTVTLAVDPVVGTLFKASARALNTSRDGGRSWEAVSLPKGFGPDGRIGSLAVPADGNGKLYLASTDKGVFKTIDHGRTWQRLTNGLPTRGSITLAAHADLPETLYAVAAEKTIYRSQDAGKSWQLMDEGPGKIGLLIHTNMKGSMQTGWLFAATPEGIQRSMDCFCLWRRAGDIKGVIGSLTYNPKQPEHVYALSNGKLFKSTDGGEVWKQPALPAPELAALAFARSGILYAVTRSGHILRSLDNAATWEAING